MAVSRKGSYSVQELLTIGLLIIVALVIYIAASMSAGATSASMPIVEVIPKIKVCKESTFSIACLKALLGW